MRSESLMTAISLYVFLSGCEIVEPGSSTADYTYPKLGSAINERLIDAPFEEVWDHLIGELVKSYFFINNVEKESRILNITFSTNTPEEYVDCGVTKIKTHYHQKEPETYEFEVAAKSNFKLAGSYGQDNNLAYFQHVKRDTKLEMRINIFVAPNKRKTKVTVNTLYIITVSFSGTVESYNAFGKLKDSQPLREMNYDVTFSTNSPETVDLGSPNESNLVTCGGKGVLERTILELASL